MDRSHMNGSYMRPYQSTCGMQFGCSGRPNRSQCDYKSDKRKKDCADCTKNRYEALTAFPLAMAYVPKQHFQKTYDHSYAFQVGTIFPELCKPFCGKRGVKKC